MKKFEFSSKPNEYPQFSGKMFYDVYKDSEFLRHSDNIKTILAKGYELRKSLKDVKPGEVVVVEGMFLENKLVIFKQYLSKYFSLCYFNNYSIIIFCYYANYM